LQKKGDGMQILYKWANAKKEKKLNKKSSKYMQLKNNAMEGSYMQMGKWNRIHKS
jgi:hypothetical protein